MKIHLSAFSDEAASDLKGQISALNRNGIRLTELRSVNGINVKDFSTFYAKEVAKELSDNGISVWSVGSPLGKTDISTDIIKYLDTVKHVCEIACALNTDKIRVFSFFNAYGDSERVFSYLNAMVRTAHSFGITLYHENEKDIYGDTAERVLEIAREVNGLKLVYDPANFIQVGEESEKTLQLLHARTDYFHIKDVISSSGELVPAGYGDGQIKKLIDMIEGEKVLSVEPHLAVFEGYSGIDSTEMKHRFVYNNNGEAFDAAVNAVKKLLDGRNYD